jgi:hypothetical protein
MVRLGEERKPWRGLRLLGVPAVGVGGVEPFDEPDLPQRFRAVELLREHAAGEVLQLLLAAGRRQRCGAHVVPEVEVGVVDPDRPPLAERHEAQLLAEARHQREPSLDVPEQLVIRRGLAREDRHAGNVHVR